MLKKILFVVAGLLTISANSLTVKAEEYLWLPKDYLVTDENGITKCYQDGELMTGKFMTSPNFLVGDTNNDSAVNATDAANVLVASAEAGASGVHAAELLANSFEFLGSKENAMLYDDVNQDGFINASDAACILVYAAEKGAGVKVMSLGSAWYYATEDGSLQKGFITDETSGKVYYGTDDYSLYKGTLNTDDGNVYLFNDDYELVQTGWVTKEDGIYYYNEDYSIPDDGFYEIDGVNYLFHENGKLCLGTFEVDGERYYFNSKDSYYYTGWLDATDPSDETIVHHGYAFDSKMFKEGLLTTNDSFEYFNRDTNVDSKDGKTYEHIYTNAMSNKCYAENYDILDGYRTIDDNELFFFDEEKHYALILTIKDEYMIDYEGVCHSIKDAQASIEELIKQCVKTDVTEKELFAEVSNYCALLYKNGSIDSPTTTFVNVMEAMGYKTVDNGDNWATYEDSNGNTVWINCEEGYVSYSIE